MVNAAFKGKTAKALLTGLCLFIAIIAGCAGSLNETPPAADVAREDAPAKAVDTSTDIDDALVLHEERPMIPEHFQPGMDYTKAPDWWLTRPEEIRKFLEQLPGVEVKKIGRTAGGRPIIAAEWGQDDMARPGLMFIGAAHGTEFEGTVAMLNYLNIVVTGRDLVGRDQPEMAETGRKFRFQIIPILNVDGRERFIDHVHWVGVNSHYFYAVTQGVFKDGRFLRYEENMRYQPMTYDEFLFFGSYRNDNGYNPVRERTDETQFQPENQALLRYARQTKPDAGIFSHSNAGSLVTAGVSRTITEELRQHINQVKYRVHLRCHQASFARYRTPPPLPPEPPENPRPPRPFAGDRLFYHTDHAYQACGMLPVHVEFPEGWDNVPDNHLDILDISLAIIDEICRYVDEKGIRAQPPTPPEE